MSSEYEDTFQQRNKRAKDELDHLRTQLSEKGLTRELLQLSLMQMTGECNAALSTSLPFCTFTHVLLESRDNLTEEQIELLQVLQASGEDLGLVLHRIRSLTSALLDVVLWHTKPDSPAAEV